jgi:hypothetical protein
MAAALLQFDPTRRRAPRVRSAGRGPFPAQEGGATILFFTGVRIERHADIEAESAPVADAEN